MFALLLVAGLSAEPVEFFPIIKADDLNGRRVTLPKDLPGQQRLIFLGYDRDQQPAIDQWVRYAVSLKQPQDQLGISEVVLMEDPGVIGRRVITSALKLAIRDRATRARVVPVYGDLAELLRLTGTTSPKTIDIILLDADGRIAWREAGRLTDSKKAELRQLVVSE